MNYQLKFILIVSLFLIGVTIVPVLANQELAELPNGDIWTFCDTSGIWHYYHHDANKWTTNNQEITLTIPLSSTDLPMSSSISPYSNNLEKPYLANDNISSTSTKGNPIRIPIIQSNVLKIRSLIFTPF